MKIVVSSAITSTCYITFLLLSNHSYGLVMKRAVPRREVTHFRSYFVAQSIAYESVKAHILNQTSHYPTDKTYIWGQAKMSTILTACSSDTDCNSKGKCENGSCNCEAAYVGALCQYNNPCNGANPCENDGDCVPVDEDGSYYCDCALGFIEPNCKQQDPCLLEGNNACMNGASCSRLDDFEFECQCQIPFNGEFCETFNLCHIDDDECIEDIKLGDIKPPICYPCISEANCTQITVTQYLCSCDPNANHTSCYASLNYKTSDTFRNRIDTRINSGNNPWMPIIPWIALACFCLYLVTAILLILFWKRSRRRPKLIVCCDLDQFDDLTYYLISVETGSQLTAGTASRAYCRIIGENGEAGPYPLNDKYLRDFHVLERGQEDNYLVSHTKDLGNLHKIAIWFGGKESSDAWFCEKVTVKSIRTKENWFFYTSTWIQSDFSSNTREFLAATDQHIKEMNNAGINCHHYCYQLTRNHIYIAPFVCTTLENVSVVAAEVMTYMLILIGMFGFLEVPDPDFHSNTEYVLTIIVLNIGSQAAGFGLLCGIVYSILFIILGRKRVPTLLVWHNRPGMPEEITDEPSEKTLPPEHPPLPSILTNESEILPEPEQVLYLDFGTNTDPSPSPPPEKRERKSSNYFRIPETDIGKTEDWIYDMAEGTSGPEEIVNKNLVHDYQSVSNENVPDKFVNYGLMGSLQDTRVLDPASFIYKVSSKESIAVESAIEKDIRDAYGSVTFKVAESDTFSTTTTGVEIDEDYSEDIEQDNLQIRDAEGDTEKVLTVQDEATSLASGDFSRGANSISNGFEQEMIKSRRGSRVQVYWELSEMYYYQFGKILPRNWVVLAYTVCIAAIVAATVVCCIYGELYGFQRTHNWCFSLLVCWIENILVFQFVKTLVVVIIVTCLINSKKLRGFEDTKIKERFQLYTVEGLTVLPDKYLLKFVLYLPQNWYPLPESSKDDNKTV